MNNFVLGSYWNPGNFVGILSSSSWLIYWFKKKIYQLKGYLSLFQSLLTFLYTQRRQTHTHIHTHTECVILNPGRKCDWGRGRLRTTKWNLLAIIKYLCKLNVIEIRHKLHPLYENNWPKFKEHHLVYFILQLFWERESVYVCMSTVGGRGREGLHTQHRTWFGAASHNPGIMTWAETSTSWATQTPWEKDFLKGNCKESDVAISNHFLQGHISSIVLELLYVGRSL